MGTHMCIKCTGKGSQQGKNIVLTSEFPVYHSSFLNNKNVDNIYSHCTVVRIHVKYLAYGKW